MDVQNVGGGIEAPFGQCQKERRFFWLPLANQPTAPSGGVTRGRYVAVDASVSDK